MSELKITAEMWYELVQRVATLEMRHGVLGPNPQQDAEFEARRDSVVKAILDQAPALPVDNSAQVLTTGEPVPGDRSHTELRADGQQKGYVVLSEGERAKGFVRPYRDAYKHVGGPGPKFGVRDLTDEEKQRYEPYAYVKFEPYPESYKGSSITGRYWTQEQLDRRGMGCGKITTMGRSIAETYARSPQFYSGTFCSSCGKHFDVGENGEFVWYEMDGSIGPRVGT